MRTIYIDSEFKCHPVDDGTMTAVETSFFDGKSDAYIEGYCFDNSKGYLARYPWKDYSELDDAQREYEKQLIAIYEESLRTVGVEV